MNKFNLNKYYTLNWLTYFSWIANIIYMFLAGYLFLIYPQKCIGNFCSLDPFVYTLTYYFWVFVITFIIILSVPVELVLRKLNKVQSFNILTMPKMLHTSLYWSGVVFIPITFILCFLLLISISKSFFGD